MSVCENLKEIVNDDKTLSFQCTKYKCDLKLETFHGFIMDICKDDQCEYQNQRCRTVEDSVK